MHPLAQADNGSEALKTLCYQFALSAMPHDWRMTTPGPLNSLPNYLSLMSLILKVVGLNPTPATNSITISRAYARDDRHVIFF
jgi:hypothetical protein